MRETGLKKVLTASLNARKQLLEPDSKDFSTRKQCELLGINRSSLYYQSKPISELDITLMNLLDEQYTKTPFYGVKRMTSCLRQLGYQVGQKRVRRLLRQMGLDAIYQRPNTSKPNPEHQVYPYLLRNVPITRCNQVFFSVLDSRGQSLRCSVSYDKTMCRARDALCPW